MIYIIKSECLSFYYVNTQDVIYVVEKYKSPGQVWKDIGQEIKVVFCVQLVH